MQGPGEKARPQEHRRYPPPGAGLSGLGGGEVQEGDHRPAQCARCHPYHEVASPPFALLAINT